MTAITTNFSGCEVDLTAESGFRTFGQMAAIIGTVTEPEKEVPPTDAGPLLGAEVAVSDDPMEVSSKQSRIENIEAIISEALAEDASPRQL